MGGRQHLRGLRTISPCQGDSSGGLVCKLAGEHEEPTQRANDRGRDEIDTPRRQERGPQDRIASHGQAACPGVDDGRVERPVRRVHAVHVGKERDRQDAVQGRPAPVAQDEEGADRQGGKEVPLVHPGRQHEEGDRDQQGRNQQASRVISPDREPGGVQGHGNEEDRSHQLPVDGEGADDHGHLLVVAPKQARRQPSCVARCGEPAPGVHPQVEGIDG